MDSQERQKVETLRNTVRVLQEAERLGMLSEDQQAELRRYGDLVRELERSDF
jgi:hypothetical protein